MTGFRNKIWDGATSDSYQDTQKASCLSWKVKFIYIKNTHASNALNYKIYGVMDLRDEADSTHLLLDEQTLAADGSIIYRTVDPWNAIYISLKNASAGNNSSAKIWINGSD